MSAPGRIRQPGTGKGRPGLYRGPRLPAGNLRGALTGELPQAQRRLLDLLRAHPDITAMDAAALLGLADTAYARRTLVNLHEAGLATRTGTGSSVDPHRYHIAAQGDA